LYVVEGFTLTDRYFSPLLADFARAVVEGCRAQGPANRKLYVPRHAREGRVVRNEAEVLREVEARGFELVEPQNLTWVEQVRIFAQASQVVGPMGSGLANAMFSPLGARIATLAPASVADTFFWRMTSVIGLDYEEIRCPTVDSPGYQRTKRIQDKDVVVDLKLLVDWLDRGKA
jgi:capsular polysaccharide biosynthesis protein